MINARTHRRRRGTAIVDTQKGILLVRGRRKYILPGGGVDRGESRKKAAIRELKEETNLSTIGCKFLFSYRGVKKKSFRRGFFRDYSKVFLIKARGKPVPSDEITKIGYYKPGSRLLMDEDTINMIRKYLSLKKRKSVKRITKRKKKRRTKK